MRPGLYIRAALVVAAVTMLNADIVGAQLIESTTSAVTTPDGHAIEVTTGFVRVPEIRTPQGPPSGTIDLAVVRLRRTGSPRHSNAHVILAGGPGDSGVNLVMGLARQGTFSSMAVVRWRCDRHRSTRHWALAPEPRHAGAIRSAARQGWFGGGVVAAHQRTSRRVAEEFRARGIRLEAYNTRESADDVADVRQALGYQRLTLWGRSYGSHLALAAAARHPRMLDRLVLIAPEGPNHTWKLPSQVDVVIRRLVARGATDLEAHMRQVLLRLAAEPVTVLVKDPQSGAQASVVLGAFDVQWITAQALGDPRLVATLPLAFREM